jgi:hypothetical protein
MNALSKYLGADGAALLECRDTIQALLENSKNQREFIAGAKKVWSKYRSSKRKVLRGRPSVWKPVISAVEAFYDKSKKDFKFQKVSDGQLIQYVRIKHPELREDAVRKYVRLNRISWIPPQDRSPADWRFIQKHAPGLLKKDFIAKQVELYRKGTDKPLSEVVKTVMKRITSALQK